MQGSTAQPLLETGRPLLTGERRFIVTLAASLRIGSTVEIERAARQIAAARSRVVALVGAADGHTMASPFAEVVGLWGFPTAARDGIGKARSTADQISAALGERVSVAVGAGEAVVLRDSRDVIWSPTLERLRQLADTAPSGAIRLDETLTADRGHDSESPIGLEGLSLLAHDVVASLAVLGEPVDAGLLARLHGVSRRTLAGLLRDLERHGVVATAAGRGQFTLELAPPVSTAVRSTLLASDCRRLHLRFATVLGWEPGRDPVVADLTAPRVARIARHLEQADEVSEAMAAMRYAAETASRENDHVAAVSHLEAALDLALTVQANMPSAERCDMIRTVATSLGALRGNADPRVSALYEQGLAVLDGTGQAMGEAHFELVWGRSTHHAVRGEIRLAQNAVRQSLRLAEALERKDLIQVATRLAGLIDLMAGDLAGARRDFERALGFGDAASLGGTARTFPFASDQVALALAGLAWVEAIAGRTVVSADLAARADARANDLGHPHTTLHVHCVLAARAHLIGSTSEAFAVARRAEAFAHDHGFAYWASWASTISAANDASLSPLEAVHLIAGALDAYAATGARQFLPFGTVLLADVLTRAGEPEAALRRLDRVAELVAPGAVELYRALWLAARAHTGAASGDPMSREAAATAYRIAHTQGATLFAGRAASAMMTATSSADDRPWASITRVLLA